jgi:hypothetical protein
VAQSVPAATAKPDEKHDRLAWRTWVPWTLVVIAAIIALISALNVWVKRQALSSDNWAKASSQLLENEKIRGALSIYLGNQLGTARKAVKVVRALSYFLFFLVLALVAAAMWIARGRRRRILLGAGVSVLVVGLIVLVVRRYAGEYLVNALTTNTDDKGAVNATWAISTQLLRNVGINAVVYGVGIIFAAWIAGPSRAATWVRRSLALTKRDRPVFIYGAVAVLFLLVLLAGPTDAQRVFPLLILFGFAFVGTEVLCRQTEREFPA